MARWRLQRRLRRAVRRRRALLSGWPAVAFIGSAEMALGAQAAGPGSCGERRAEGRRRGAEVIAAADGPAPDHRRALVTVDDVARHSETLLQAGQVPTARAIQREMQFGQRAAGRLRKQLTAQ
jgi:hypothetical protein